MIKWSMSMGQWYNFRILLTIPILGFTVFTFLKDYLGNYGVLALLVWLLLLLVFVTVYLKNESEENEEATDYCESVP
jgi:Ca2+/Na+ antiporter